MGLFQRMGENRSAGEFLETGEIAGVIEMAMGEEDGLDVRPVQAELAQDSRQSRHFAHKSRVDQDRFMLGGVVKEVE